MYFNNINKILVIRKDGIGDLLNSTPAISALKGAYREAQITVMAKAPYHEILYKNPDLDCIFEYKAKNLTQKINFLKRIRRENYDMTIVLQNSSFCNFTAIVSGAKYRIGRKGKRFNFALTHKVKNKNIKGQKHEIQRNLDVMKLAGIHTDNMDLVFKLSQEEKDWATQYLRENGITNRDRIIGVHPGGSSFDKLWPVENFASVVDSLVNKYNAKILIFSGPGERELEENFSRCIRSHFLNVSGVSIRQFAGLVEKCFFFLCNDSGPMHIAAALKVSTLAIFGPTDHIRWKPYNDRAVVVRQDMDCWPCSAHKCRKEYECIKSLPVERVLDAAFSILG